MSSAHCHRIALGGQTSCFTVWFQDSSECSQDGVNSLPKRIFQTTSSVLCNSLVFWGHGVRGRSEKGNILFIQMQTWMKGCLYNCFIITTLELKKNTFQDEVSEGTMAWEPPHFTFLDLKMWSQEESLNQEKEVWRMGKSFADERRVHNGLFSSWMKLC